MLLSYVELVALLEAGVVHYADVAAVNSTSIDLTLGNKVLYEKCRTDLYTPRKFVSMRDRDPLDMIEWDLEEEPFPLMPGQFVLAQTRQMFYLPNDLSAEYKLKSSMARIGLEHLNAGWCDAGWNGSVLTLELKNMTQNHIIMLEADMPAGQMVFFKHTPVPDHASYSRRGRYNNDATVKGIKE